MKYNLQQIFQRSSRSFGKRYIIGGVVLAIVVILALGIGLGVGLHKSSTEGQTSAQKETLTSSSSSTTKTMTSTTETVHTTVSTQTSRQTSQTPTTTTTTTPTTTTTQATTTTTLPEVEWLEQPCLDQRENKTCPWSTNPVLLVSLDGFRADYLLRNLTPVIQKLRTCGVHTPYMRAVYPTLTFPNHYTIVTGLYPESHGIVGNNMYDPDFNASFTLYGREKYNPRWWRGEPIWSTAMKQGKRTASYFWVGSDVNISGIQPDIWHKYDGSVTFADRVQAVLDWLTLPDGERPDFTTLYFNEPDHTGHGSGPDSPEEDAMLKQVDDIIRLLMNGLAARQLDHCVNLMIMADHGMASTSCGRQVVLDNFHKDIDEEALIYGGTTGHINSHFYKGSKGVVYNTTDAMTTDELMTSFECKDVHLNVYSRNTIPRRHHYTNSPRIGSLVMDIESEWLVYASERRSCLKGNHGFDNIYKSMHAMFLAHGPAFKANIETKPFENIELYNLMAELLDIVPAPNNGTIGSLHHLLKAPRPLPNFTDDQTYAACSSSTTRPPLDCHCENTTEYTAPGPADVVSPHPVGQPVLKQGVTACILPGRQFTTAYDQDNRMPLWTSFTLSQAQILNYTSGADQWSCVVPDPRLTEQVNPACSVADLHGKNVSLFHLFDQGFANTDADVTEALLSSAAVPMHNGFQTGIWNSVWQVVREYVSKYGDVHVTTGPMFDSDGDGLRDSNVSNASGIPTHFFLTLVKCKSGSTDLSDCPPDDLDILSLVLPHQPRTHNCLIKRDFLHNHVARIRDIEELTGVRFFTKFPRAAGARLGTFLPTELWKSDLLTPWEERPCTTQAASQCPLGGRPLLLVSLDGFRADYLARNLTPTLEKLKTCGVHTPFMRAVYPTVTFPNHYTIVTGLYPESHGIVYNTVYDEEIDSIFTISHSKDPRFWKGEPIWITAQNQGKKAATYFWPGSDVNISGIYPDIYKPYDGTVGYTQRLYDVIDWLTLPEESRPDFVTLYFDQPDHAGHMDGPDSEAVNGQIETVDKLINSLMTTLYEKRLENCIDMIILADHGFAKESCEKTVEVENYFPNITEMYMIERVLGQVFPQFVKLNSTEVDRLPEAFSINDIVESLECKTSPMKVFTKDTIPRRHHYANSPRIADILLDMKEEWLVFNDNAYYCEGGNHGWDNIVKKMHAMFLAHGPSFKNNFAAQPFENIELYNLMSEILGITPAPNNGTLGSLNYLLKNPPHVPAANISRPYSNCPGLPEDDLLPICSCQLNSSLTLASVAGNQNTSVMVFGEPEITNSDDVCILMNNDSNTGFSKTLNSPVWNTILMTKKEKKNMTGSTNPCLLKDPRTPTASVADCPLLKDNISFALLYDADGTTPGQLSSQVIPMYEGFQKGVWTFLWRLVAEFSEIYGPLSVTTGPIYDYNNDGLWEGRINISQYADHNNTVLLPTHVYVIIAKCKDDSSSLPCDGDIDLMSFILPNLQETPNCLRHADFLEDNTARIRDIELLSGLQFLTSFNASYGARLRTFLSENIWPSPMTRPWIEYPCPDRDLCDSDYKPLLLISLDGFRADYLLRNATPIIGRLSQCGVQAPYMRSVYPTKTFPNHYTIVTGLYPESHGIIDNNMYDPNIGKFSMSSPVAKNSSWWGGEPIWNTAMNQGKRAATFFWPGSDVEIEGMYPDIWRPYDGSVSYSSRVSEVLSWMSLPKEHRPHFITLYFDEPDLAGHKYGTSSYEVSSFAANKTVTMRTPYNEPTNETTEVVEFAKIFKLHMKNKQIDEALNRVDAAVGQLMTGLVEKNLHHCVNLVIIADHGMEDVSCKRIVRLKDYIDYGFMSDNTYVWEGPFGRIATKYQYRSGNIVPNPNPVDDAEILNNLTCKNPHLHVYTKSDLPVRHHYTNNARIDDIILDMDTSWLVTRSYIRTCKGGNHGYDNIYKSMEALFLAYGPAFNWNVTVEPFENIELYNMFSEILGLDPAPNNGTFGSLNDILRSPTPIVNDDKAANYSDGRTMISSTLPTFEDLWSNYSSWTCPQDCSWVANNTMAQTVIRDLFNDIYNANAQDVSNKHLPWGKPVMTGRRFAPPSVPLATLVQSTMVTGYDSQLAMPVWLSQTVHTVQGPTVERVPSSRCQVTDVRVSREEDIHKCQSTNPTAWTSLARQGLTAEGYSRALQRLSSTFAPMLPGFVNGTWANIQNILEHWIVRYNQVNVVSGPVYDTNHDGLADTMGEIESYYGNTTVLPTHFFLVVTRCAVSVTKLRECNTPVTAAYILPHTSRPTNCKSVEDYINDNEARVRDVELITGLRFFDALPSLTAVKLRTFLPQGLWPYDN